MKHEDLPKLGGKSMLELLLAQHLREKNCPAPERQHKCVVGRQFLFDFAWPEFMVAVEVQGGQWVRGKHNRPEGYEIDCDKANMATLQGWRVLRFTGAQIEDGRARDCILKMLGLAP